MYDSDFRQSILLREMILYLNDQSAPWSWAITLLVLMILVRFVSIYFMAGAFGITAVFSGAGCLFWWKTM